MAKAAARKGPKAPKAAAPVAPGKPRALPSVSVAGFDLAELRELIDLVQGTGIGELELGSSGRSVRISATPSAGGGGVAAPRSLSAPAAAVIPAAEAKPMAAPPVNHTPVTSPMVGTFYRSPAPDADPFVEVGDIIEVGQTVCIIEAMKLMNEIESEVKGRVVQILVENAQAVEFGQKLFLVEPV